MREIPKKNYIILIITLVIVVLLTLFLANMYKNKTKETTILYDYVKKIETKEFKQYVIENPDSIIYISNKYDLDLNDFENKLVEKINSYNLNDYTVFIDTNKNIESLKKELSKDYNIKLDESKYPIILIMDNKQVTSVTYVDINNYNIDDLIDYEALK